MVTLYVKCDRSSLNNSWAMSRDNRSYSMRVKRKSFLMVKSVLAFYNSLNSLKWTGMKGNVSNRKSQKDENPSTS